jgi:hypothetical protein
VVDLGLRRRILLHQLGVPNKLRLCVGERRLLLQHLGLSLLQLILVLVLLYRKEEIALLDELAVLVMDLFQITLDARDEFDGVHRGGIAGDLHIIGDALGPGSDYRDRRRGLLRQLRLHDPGCRRGRQSFGFGRCRYGQRVRPPDLDKAIPTKDGQSHDQGDGQTHSGRLGACGKHFHSDLTIAAAGGSD